MKTYSLTNPPQAGEDIKQLQAALHIDGFYPGTLDGVFGSITANACKKAKYQFGYPMSAVLPTGGQELLDYLDGNKSLPLAYRLRRRQRGYGISKEDLIRQKIIAYGLWACNNNPAIHYAQVRPMDHLDKVEVLPWWTDCSEFVTTLYKWAGAPDPNGWGYNGYGYTGTMLSQGEFIHLSEAKMADVIIWGEFPGHHTALISKIESDPMIISMGNENQPAEYRMSIENAAQGNRPYFIKRYIGV